MQNGKSVNKINLKTRDLVQIALMSAMVFAVTKAFNFKIGNEAFHLGDSMIFIAAILLGKEKGAISAGIGMGLFDMLSPFIIWAPFTFIIKGVMGYIAGSIAYRKGFNGNNFKNNTFAFSIAGVWMIIGYYIAGGILYGFKVSLPGILVNIGQVVVGMIIALPLVGELKKSVFRS